MRTVLWYTHSVIRRRLDDLLKGRSRYWLAQEIGISEGNLRRLARQETTRIEFETLEKICRALGCGAGDLLEIVDDEKAAKRHVRKRRSKKAGRKKKST